MLSRRDFLATASFAPALAAAAQKDPVVPRKAPELIITLNSGEQLFLSNYRGKVVALEILLTTCPHCQTCSRHMQDMFAEFGHQGFQPLGAAVNDNARLLVPQYIYSLGLKFPVGVSDREATYQFLQVDQNAGPVYMPQLVFIDRAGIIRAQYPGTDKFFTDEEKNMRNQISSMLKAPARAAATPKGKR